MFLVPIIIVLWLAICLIVVAICQTAARGDAATSSLTQITGSQSTPFTEKELVPSATSVAERELADSRTRLQPSAS
jgi:hypothetical protein